MIDKRGLVATLRARLSAEMMRTRESQQATQAGATHTESKAENDKDTRALESTYLARGLAERVVAAQADLARLDRMVVREFGDDDAIGLSALVALEGGDDEAGPAELYFLAPVGGGARLDVAGVIVVVVTPQSPVGRALVGRAVGDDVRIVTPAGLTEASVLTVR